jgi:hypothetical protein
MQHACEKYEMHTVFWFESLKRRDHLKNLDVYENIIIKWILGNRVGEC